MNEVDLEDEKTEDLICGIVMPISAIDGCSEEHWMEVRSIIDDSVNIAGFKSCLVSDADDSGIIQNRIIQNLYDNKIVVCDVSCKNPNVMFELGIRLAFDKPTIVIKDDMTDYSFDTSPIEHIKYPRDLRYQKIMKFKKDLSTKIKGTYEASTKDGYTTFLKHFGRFTVAKLDEKEITSDQLILDLIKDLSSKVDRLSRGNDYLYRPAI